MKKSFGYEEVLLFNKGTGHPLQYSIRSIRDVEDIKEATLRALDMLQCDIRRVTIEEYERYNV